MSDEDEQIEPEKKALITLSIELGDKKKQLLNIYSDSKPEQLAYDFCLQNNLDFDSMLGLCEEIKHALNNYKSDSNPEIKNQISEENEPNTSNKKKAKEEEKEEIEEIEKNIMDKCNQVMIKDYNEYYQEKLKEFPMMKSLKFGKKTKDKENKENTEKIDDENENINDDNIDNENDITINNKKTPGKTKKKIFENVKVKKELKKSVKSKSKSKNQEKKEDSKEKKHKNIKKQNSAKKTNKLLNIDDDKELKILKSGEKILQKDRNILIKEAENKYKEKQKLKKDEKIYYSFTLVFPAKERSFYCSSKEIHDNFIEKLKEAFGYLNFLDYYEMLDDLSEGIFGNIKLGVGEKDVVFLMTVSIVTIVVLFFGIF